MTDPIYLDYAASTPIDPQVAQVMSAHMTMSGVFGNPASRSHVYGWQAEEAVEEARVQVAEVLGADPREIIWTSGATESNNLAIKGVAYKAVSGHIITSTVEHKAVLDPCDYLQQQGFEITYLRPDEFGRVSPESVEAALREDTLLVSLMQVNNELGTINDIARIAEICRQRGVLTHTDGAQSFGKVAIDIKALGVDLFSISAHKIYGPKGMGALYVRKNEGLKLAAQIHGGGHEMGMRSGTLATHQIVGLGAASKLMQAQMAQEQMQYGQLRRRFLSQLQRLEGYKVNSHPEEGLPQILNIGFAGIDGETLMLALNGLAVSSGSACTSASVEPSHVLRGIGLADDIAHASLRFSFGRFSNDGDVDAATRQIINVVERLRGN
jgi:cysteine desulfurase